MRRYHKSHARWYKYFREVDRMLKPIICEYDDGIIEVDEFNRREQKIYDHMDKLDDDDYFKNLPDTDDEDT